MDSLKHVGRIVETNRKCLVAYRTLPNDAFNCLIIPTETLDPTNHDALMKLVESPAAQEAYEFAEALARAMFPDGSTMLANLHVKGQMIAVPTDKVEMCPNPNATINLAELNQLIAEQQGISVQDLALKDPTDNTEIKDLGVVNELPVDDLLEDDVTRTTSASVNQSEETVAEQPLTTEDKARSYRSQADKLSKQAAELRRLAEELVPTKRRVAVKE